MSEPAGPVPNRDAEADDYDLLTYAEARARLADEITAQRHRLAALQARQPAAGPEETAAARRRLDQLLDAADRDTRPHLNAANFEHFFGYKPDTTT